MIVIKVMESDDSNPTVKRFEDVIDSLVKRMISCELIHFELVTALFRYIEILQFAL